MFELCLEQRSEQVLRILGDYVSVFLILTNCNILVNRSNIQLQSDESRPNTDSLFSSWLEPKQLTRYTQ